MTTIIAISPRGSWALTGCMTTMTMWACSILSTIWDENALRYIIEIKDKFIRHNSILGKWNYVVDTNGFS